MYINKIQNKSCNKLRLSHCFLILCLLAEALILLIFNISYHSSATFTYRHRGYLTSIKDTRKPNLKFLKLMLCICFSGRITKEFWFSLTYIMNKHPKILPQHQNNTCTNLLSNIKQAPFSTQMPPTGLQNVRKVTYKAPSSIVLPETWPPLWPPESAD